MVNIKNDLIKLSTEFYYLQDNIKYTFIEIKLENFNIFFS